MFGASAASTAEWVLYEPTRVNSITVGSSATSECGAPGVCLLYTSDAADDRLCVALGGGRILKKKNKQIQSE